MHETVIIADSSPLLNPFHHTQAAEYRGAELSQYGI